ncbi:acylphosphatase [Candidatus Woesearchaeota archaeon]|jgi:acylphosphatase|nr:acylphosphatase [Candidatus Woesearchaeota archaeon]MDP6647985.1 acylphosphatase [Candidatus Woesearchaeota archaeon]|tara:strand:- start:24811 stop:25077 length:267 start_codon:yes stop_codon:yes gene_type:complete
MKCIHLIVSGKVQGVFFRSNIKDKALELGLHGYANNLADGNVEIAAQGNEDKLNELIEFIRNGPGSAKVTNIDVKHKELEDFTDFDIK